MSERSPGTWIVTIDEPVFYGRLYSRLITARSDRIEGVIVLPGLAGRGVARTLANARYYLSFYGLRGFLAATWRLARARWDSSGDPLYRAKRHGVVGHRCASLDEAVAILRQVGAHCCLATVLCRVPAVALEALAGGWVNTHCGPLPRYAGLDAPFWCLYHDEPELTVTLHYMATRFDSGPIIAQRSIPNDGRPYFALVDALFDVAFELHRDFLRDFRPSPAEARAQDRSQRSYFGKPPAAAGRAFRRRGGRFA